MRAALKTLSICAATFVLTTFYMNCSEPVHIAGVEPLNSDIPVPVAPTNLNAQAASSIQIDLSWTDNSSDEIGFVVERSLNAAGPFVQVGAADMGVAVHQDSSLAASTTYYYRVAAYNAGGKSTYTLVANATTDAPALNPPAAPTVLASTGTTGSTVTLAWNDNSTDESGFKLERATNMAGPFAVIATVNANLETYADSSLDSLTTYYYRLYAFNTSGNSATTGTVNATTLAAVPSAPTGPSATPVSVTAINVTWTDSSSGETGFKVERALASAGPYSVVGTIAANTSSFSDTGLNAATNYYYRIYAYSGSGDSAKTSAVTAMTFGTYSWINSNIIVPKCVSCHTGVGGGTQAYLMGSYAEVMGGVVPGNANASMFYIECASGSMPLGAPNLTADQLKALRTWINSGAANN